MTDFETCIQRRPDFALATTPHDDPAYELIGATWTASGELRARYVVVQSDADTDERERQTATLLDFCRRRIEAGNDAEHDIPSG